MWNRVNVYCNACRGSAITQMGNGSHKGSDHKSVNQHSQTSDHGSKIAGQRSAIVGRKSKSIWLTTGNRYTQPLYALCLNLSRKKYRITPRKALASPASNPRVQLQFWVRLTIPFATVNQTAEWMK